MNRKGPHPQAFSAEVKYELSKDQIEDALRVHAGMPDGIVEWDISNRGKVRGATVKVIRTEIKG